MITSRLLPVAGLAALCALVAGAPAASAATQRYAAPAGSGDACSAAVPCAITKAIHDADTGDEVIVKPGDYQLSATLDTTHQIAIHGVPGEPRPRLMFSGSNQIGLWLWFSSSLSHVEIDQAASGSDQSALIVFDGSKADQVVARAQDVAVDARHGSTITNTLAVASANDGRALVAGAVGSYVNTNTFRNVTAIATGASGVAVEAFAKTSGHATINLVNSIARGGAYSFKSTTDNTGASAAINVSNSNWSGWSLVGTNTSVKDGGGHQTASPAFVNAAAGDYHQAPGSPTIDAGKVDAANGTSDVDGDPRAIGITDLGADEFVAAPAATTGAAGAVNQQSAQLSGSVDPKGAPTTYRFEFGPTTQYGSSTAPAGAGSGMAAVATAATVGGLSPATTYHYRVVATNTGGTTKGADRTFTTAPAPSPATPPSDATGIFGGVKLVSTRLASHGKFIVLKLRCSSAAVDRCSGRTKLSARRRTRLGPASAITLGRSRFSIASGTQAKVRIRVSRAGGRLLHRATRVRGKATSLATDGAARSKTTVTAVTVRRTHQPLG